MNYSVEQDHVYESRNQLKKDITLYWYVIKRELQIVARFNVRDDYTNLFIDELRMSRLIDYQVLFSCIVDFLNNNFDAANYFFCPVIYYGYNRLYYSFDQKQTKNRYEQNERELRSLNRFRIDSKAFDRIEFSYQYDAYPRVDLKLLVAEDFASIYDKELLMTVIDFMTNVSTYCIYIEKSIQWYVLAKSYKPKHQLKVGKHKLEISLYYNVNDNRKEAMLYPPVKTVARDYKTFEVATVKRRFKLFRKQMTNVDTGQKYFVIGIVFNRSIRLVGDSWWRFMMTFTLNIDNKQYASQDRYCDYRLDSLLKMDEHNYNTQLFGSYIKESNIVGLFVPETDEDYKKSIDPKIYGDEEFYLSLNRRRGIDTGFYGHPHLITMMKSIHKDYKHVGTIDELPKFRFSKFKIPNELIAKPKPQNLGFVYIVDVGKDIYKISTDGYPTNSKCLYLHYVGTENTQHLDTKIKTVLLEKFKQRDDIGSEYYEGNKLEIISIVSKICNNLSL